MYDVIVIGVGGMGSAALYHVASRGRSVLGLERFDIPHEFGSSHGMSRIIRLAYAEGWFYVPLLRRAYELWRELEAHAAEKLLVNTGGIDAGAENSQTVRGVLESCARYRLQHEMLRQGAVNERFPGYHLPKRMVAVFQEESGFLVPERCIVSYVRAAQELGAEVHRRERVVECRVAKGGVQVVTEQRAYRAKKVIVTAGPWVASIFPALATVAVPQRQVVIWTQPRRHPEHFTVGVFPVFNLEAPEGRFYGFPVYSVPGFKIGKYYHRRQRVNPDEIDRDGHREDEKVLREGIRKYFPDANGSTIAMQTCMFTNSPDKHFILDLHPAHPEIAIAAGFSGHGFKFCSVVGEIMAQLVLDGRTRHDIRAFALDRPRLRNEISKTAYGKTIKT
ncbi:MAG TPA: N-methyl-L-tryptophan oxidase [Thermoanaerobaculia bacterium]|nr:N-methyl-L-tryptophan oxidase [Thermoanaerobaculia bacterium]